jgi:hypothetical protein
MGVTQPDWPAINRAISESIEPFASLALPTDTVVDEVRPSPLGAWVALSNYELGDEPSWYARDWREPAAAMELLKRMPNALLWRSENEPVWHYGKTVAASTPEEAIVLAYWETIKGGERV